MFVDLSEILTILSILYMGLNMMLQANNKRADQPVQQRSLISTFVICYLERILVKHAPCKISIFYTGLDKNFQRKIVNIFLPTNFNICFGCSKELSH